MKTDYKCICAAILSIFLVGYTLAEDISADPIAEPAVDPAVEAKDSKPWSIDLTSDFFTSYMFRGFNLYDGAVFQPSVRANYIFADESEISTSIWYSKGLEHKKDLENFSEVDYSIGYTKEIDSVSLSVGNLWYTYPGGAVEGVPATSELYASISYDTLLSPTLTFYHDYDAYKNQYYELGLSHAFETDWVADGLTITPNTALGFATNSKNVYQKDGLEQISAGVSFEIYFGDLTVKPSINYMFKVDENTVNNFWSGVSLSYSF